MKILAIRGQNLASLARTFEIDLANGPLRNVGLFAITGPVGAGKSTLLDALCLALFDRTPRLSNRGGVLVGDDSEAQKDWLRSSDPRTLLRRDAADGFAEADFTGRDGVRYRARWSVRRARLRRDGRIQDQDMSLRDLDRSVVVASGRKTDVLAAIELRLGLDFGQFCRSVLLAQGEFAAFLRASADERAHLLENLTGADIYRKLSRAAHERRVAYEKRVLDLRTQLAMHELLEDAARAALEATGAQLQREHEASAVGVELASRYVRWHETAAQRRQEESDATVALQAAMAADAMAAPRRARHLQLANALPLVPRWEFVLQRQSEQAVLATAEESAAAAVARAAALAAAARQKLQPVLAATFGARGGGTAHGASDEDVVCPRLVRELPRWEAALGEWAANAARAHELSQQRPQLLAAEQAAAVTAAAARQRLLAAETERGETSVRVEAARIACDAPEFAELAVLRRRLGAERERLRQLGDLLGALAAAAAGREVAAERVVQAGSVRDDLQRGFADLVAERQAAVEALRRARRAEDQRRTEVGLAALRAQLVAGEPCPLCGALEHPTGATHDDEALTAAASVAAAAQARFEQAQQAVVTREAARAQAEEALTAARRNGGHRLDARARRVVGCRSGSVGTGRAHGRPARGAGVARPAARRV